MCEALSGAGAYFQSVAKFSATEDIVGIVTKCNRRDTENAETDAERKINFLYSRRLSLWPRRLGGCISSYPFYADDMNAKLLDLQAQYLPIRTEIRRAIDEVRDSQQLILGPYVEKFEKSLAEYCHSKNAIGG